MTESKAVKRTASVQDGKGLVRFEFENGEVREFLFDREHPLLMKLALHGALAKIGSEMAGTEGVEGRAAAVKATIARLDAGVWNAQRQGKGEGHGAAGIVLRAIAEARGETIEEAKAFVNRKMAQLEAVGSGITLQAFYSRFRVAGTRTAAIIVRLEAERDARKASKTPHAAVFVESLLDK